MNNRVALPLLGAIAILGGTSGVLLGKSAVGEINPFYYTPRAERFHADLGVAPPRFDAPPALTAPALVANRGGCIGCRTWPEEYRPARARAPEVAIASMVEPAAIESPAEPVAETAPETAEILRYASYPVEAVEPLEAATPETAPAS